VIIRAREFGTAAWGGGMMVMICFMIAALHGVLAYLGGCDVSAIVPLA
jgi:hypothetical protein